jgi:prepilin-type N-terminal cleavage/methylation domain-containing protein
MNHVFQVNNRKRRAGFTLVELLVVIGIILLLTVAAAPVAFSMLNGRAIREASSSVQAVLAGARDRAAFAREARGVRLVTDTATGNPSLVREIRYIRPAAPLSTGSAIVVDSNWNNPWNDYTVPFPPGAMVGPQPVGSSWINNTAPPANPIFSLVVLLGCQDKDRLKSLPFRMAGSTRVYFGVIRLATSGQLLGFSTTDAMIDTVIGGINFPYLRLDRPLPRPVPFDELRLGQLPHRSALIPPAGMQMLDYLPHVGVEYQIPIGFVELEGENPIKLPSGVVIDLGYIDPTGAAAPDPTGVRLSRLQPEYQHWDIVFAPNGQVIGAAAAEAHVFLWLRDELAATDDITVPVATAPSGFMRVIPVNNSGNHAIVAIAARTGLIRSVEPNFGTAIGSASTATMDAALAPGASFEYWNYRSLYDLYFSQLSAPDGGETGL